MRPRYVVLILALALGAAVVVFGPVKGRSVEAGFRELASLTSSALSDAAARVHAALSGSSTQDTADSDAPLPPEVTVSQPVTQNITEWDEYTGRFDAVEAVEVRARVSGYLDKVNFTDGQDVKAGDLLFEIDPRPFERALEQANAELNQAKVRVSNASLDVERGRPLLKSDHISKKTFDDRENVMREAQAAVKVAEARVKTAELELSFCRITAPISGRISETLVTPGNFVSGGGAADGTTVLTTIVTQDPIYIYFDVSENNALKYTRLTEATGKGATGMLGAAVGVALPDEDDFAHAGKLDFLDNRLDRGTGTLRARAVVPNRGALFSAGMFARVRLQGSPEYTAVMLPDEAIGTDQANRFVYVLGTDDVPVRRLVKPGPLVDGLRVVREGIGPEDWVVIRGQQRVRPDQKISPKHIPLKVSDAKGNTSSVKKP
ncbi:MAG TPA: efflux RND transporter periplasmic adaptor subunit [Hyphomicrobium sp.]